MKNSQELMKEKPKIMKNNQKERNISLNHKGNNKLKYPKGLIAE